MPHSKHHKCHCPDCDRERKHHRPKVQDVPKEWTGKDHRKDTDRSKEHRVSLPQSTQVKAKPRSWSPWEPMPEWEFFWRGRMKDDGERFPDASPMSVVADSGAGTPEYEFTQDFVTVWPQQQMAQWPIQPRAVKTENAVPGAQRRDQQVDQAQMVDKLRSLSLDQPTDSTGEAVTPYHQVAVGGPIPAAAKRAHVPAPVQKVPMPASGPAKKAHGHSKGIGSLVKADKKLKLDSKSKVRDWYLEWDDGEAQAAEGV
ncbi:hypothetical protein NKR23_g11805 [Pleurostoma richardsiae]|uniref:Uncharacterized protein n=1 Tax=Pleurostoma richardsiae TaxID=41990 RepID=A0AA38R107_9PEZI|nr:hypothetical protein NKR23_g11805 [Pleurostoma richardsiae]